MEEYHEAICPVCGRTGGKIYAPKPWVGNEDWEELSKEERERQWRKIRAGMRPVSYFSDYIVPGYDIDRDYWGVIRRTGSGRFEIIGHLERPEDDPELFGGVKEALLLAVQHYLRRGWITPDELEGIIQQEGG